MTGKITYPHCMVAGGHRPIDFISNFLVLWCMWRGSQWEACYTIYLVVYIVAERYVELPKKGLMIPS